MDAKTGTILRELADDEVHGANYLASMGLAALGNYMREHHFRNVAGALAGIRQIARRIAKTRPSMAPVAVAMMRAETAAKTLAKTQMELNTFLEKFNRKITTIRRRLKTARDRAAHNALVLIKGKHAVLTHSRSATIMRVFELFPELFPKLFPKYNLNVYVTESRPGAEGIETARALLNLGYRVTLIPDMAAATFMTEVELVLVGADTVLPDGSVINKSGTRMLAMSAHETGIPFYVITDTFKFNPQATVRLEEKDPREITQLVHPKLTIRNLYFDLTPASLITAIVTD